MYALTLASVRLRPPGPTLVPGVLELEEVFIYLLSKTYPIIKKSYCGRWGFGSGGLRAPHVVAFAHVAGHCWHCYFSLSFLWSRRFTSPTPFWETQEVDFWYATLFDWVIKLLTKNQLPGYPEVGENNCMEKKCMSIVKINIFIQIRLNQSINQYI